MRVVPPRLCWLVIVLYVAHTTNAQAFKPKTVLNGTRIVRDEFFHDMSDFPTQLQKLLAGTNTPGRYQPRAWIRKNYGNDHAGKRLLDFVVDNFGHQVHIPSETSLLLT